MIRASLERINPDSILPEDKPGQETLRLHLERYRFAGKYLLPGTVADIACGTGYGSYLLASEFAAKTQKILAVDKDAESILYAEKKYAHPSILFRNADAMQFVPEFFLDNIVSLETLEHLPDPTGFVSYLVRWLKPGGRWIASVPITPSMDANPFHLHDFRPKSFRKLFLPLGMEEIDHLLQVQPFNPFHPAGKGKEGSRELRKNIPTWYLQHPAKFFLRMKSLLADGFCNKYLVAVFEKKA